MRQKLSEGVVDQYGNRNIGKELAEIAERIDCANRRSIKFEDKYLILGLPFFSVVTTFTVMYRWEKVLFGDG